MELTIRRYYTFIEHNLIEAGRPHGEPLRKVAAVAIVENPYAGRYVDDLEPLIAASACLGKELARLAVEALAPYKAQSYGKAGIVGLDGEQEHANALLTTVFATPLRSAVGGGKAWVPSYTKRSSPGATVDVPLACKDALYVRSHYDGITVTLPDAPLASEIAVIVGVANRGRLNARVGGLRFEDVKGQDGLV